MRMFSATVRFGKMPRPSGIVHTPARASESGAAPVMSRSRHRDGTRGGADLTGDDAERGALAGACSVRAAPPPCPEARRGRCRAAPGCARSLPDALQLEDRGRCRDVEVEGSGTVDRQCVVQSRTCSSSKGTDNPSSSRRSGSGCSSGTGVPRPRPAPTSPSQSTIPSGRRASVTPMIRAAGWRAPRGRTPPRPAPGARRGRPGRARRSPR